MAAFLCRGARLAADPPHSPTPGHGNLYWQARYLGKDRTESNLRQSVQLFQQAAVREPGNAWVQSALAGGHAWLLFFHLAPWPEAADTAKTAAREALRRRPGLAEAWEALALVALFKEWDWPEAERCLHRALAANANSAQAHHIYALGLATHSRFAEALAQARRAFDLDPSSYVANNDLQVVLYCVGRYEETRDNARQTLSVRPDWAPAYVMAGQSEAAAGRLSQAVQYFQRAESLSPGNTYCMGRLGHALARSGDREAALRVAASLERRAATEFVPHVDLAWPYIGLGDSQRALDHLEQAATGRETDLVFVAVDPIYESLHADGRFRTLVQRLGLP